MYGAHPIPELDASGLRRFGLTMGGIVAGLFGLFLPWWLERGIPFWPWILASVLIIWGLIAPSSLRPVYRGWITLGLLLNKIMSPLIMSLVYFLVVTPMGLVRRLLGHGLPMYCDAQIESYRVKSRKTEDLERPF